WNYPGRNDVAVHTLTEQWPYRGMVLGAHVMRAVSSVMGAVSVALVAAIAWTVTGSSAVALLAAGAAALTPGFLLASATIDNDNAAVLASTGSLLVLMKAMSKPRSWPWFAGFGAAAGLALLAKANTYFLAPLGLAAVALLFVRERLQRRAGALGRAAANAGLLLGGLVLSAGWFYLLPRQAGGRFLSEYASDANVLDFMASRPDRLWGTIRNVFETYWGSFGWEVFHLPQPWYVACLGVCLVSLGGWLLGGVRTGWGGAWRMVARETRGQQLLVLGLGTLLLLASIVHLNLATHDAGATAHARFLFPALAATSLGLAYGLWRLPGLARPLGVTALLGISLGVIGFSLATIPPAFEQTALPVYSDLDSAQAEHRISVTFDKAGIGLSGWTLAPSSDLRPGGQLIVTLLWAAGIPPKADYSAVLRLTDKTGNVVHDQDHAPGTAIMLPSSLWRPGEIVPDAWQVAIPPDTAPGPYSIEVGVYDYRDGTPILAGGTLPAATIGQLDIASA
ncbi:MAG TPA: glycosyltransferase family 39 protein, partial [Chloroflexota bacterium]